MWMWIAGLVAMLADRNRSKTDARQADEERGVRTAGALEYDGHVCVPFGGDLESMGAAGTRAPYQQDPCPVCAADPKKNSGCRCLVNERTCSNGHRWVTCPEHGTKTVLEENENLHEGPDIVTFDGPSCLCPERWRKT